MNKTRLLAGILASLMLLGSLVSCGEVIENTDTGSADTQADAAQTYGAYSLPTTFFIDAPRIPTPPLPLP